MFDPRHYKSFVYELAKGGCYLTEDEGLVSTTHASMIENFVFDKEGNFKIRAPLKRIIKAGSTPIDYVFPFLRYSVLFQRRFGKDESFEFEGTEGNILYFKTNNIALYEQTYVFKVIDSNGIETILKISDLGQKVIDNEPIYYLKSSFHFGNSLTIVELQISTYSVIIFDEEEGKFSGILKNVSGLGLWGSCLYLDSLFLFNGHDPVLIVEPPHSEGDFPTVKEYKEEIPLKTKTLSVKKDLQSTDTLLIETELTYVVSNFEERYRGKNFNLHFSDKTVLNFTPTNIALSVTPKTYIFRTSIKDLSYVGKSATKLCLVKALPNFYHMFPFYNRLFCLGSYDKALFYSARKNKKDGFFSETDEEIPFLELSSQIDARDQPLSLTSYQDKLILVGVKKSYVFSENLEPGFETSPVLFNQSIDVGIINKNLFIKYPNDIIFFTLGGVKSLSTLNIGNQYSLSSLENVDPFVKESLRQVFNDPLKQTNICSCYYEKGGFSLINFGAEKTLIGFGSLFPERWSFFSSDFPRAMCFSIGRFNDLYLTSPGGVLKYAINEKVISSDYGDKPIPFLIKSHILLEKNRILACKFIEFDISTSPYFKERGGNFLFSVLINDTSPKKITKEVDFQKNPSRLENEMIDSFILGTETKPDILPFKFVTRGASLMIEGWTKTQLILKKVHFYGI